jgi:hypothetical protein
MCRISGGSASTSVECREAQVLPVAAAAAPAKEEDEGGNRSKTKV